MTRNNSQCVCIHCKEKKTTDDDYYCNQCISIINEGKTIRPLCIDCKKNPARPNKYLNDYYCVDDAQRLLRCCSCDQKYLEKLKYHENKKLLIPTQKICANCSKEYEAIGKNSKYCHSPCTSMRKEMTQAEKWLAKKEPSTERKNGEAVAYSFFRKKYGVNKTFRVCR